MRATLKNYRQSPQKVRLVADAVRGKSVLHALTALSFLPKRAALPLKKLIESAVANAKESGASADNLMIDRIAVDEGIVFKRLEYRARGSANVINRRSSHISVVLGELSRDKKGKGEGEGAAVDATGN
jgi:large subunit ribosomal protein L22